LLLFLPYLAFVASMQYRSLARSLGIDPRESSLPPFGWGIVLAVGLFVAILLHELAHTLVALQSGARVRSITLMMLGGVSSIERDVSPSREAWMAFVGPLASFAIAAVAYLLYRLTVPFPDVAVAFLWFALTNTLVGAFNLLPAFPMDGGRVLRGLLASRIGILRATNIATRTGQVLAILFAVWGFLNFNVILMLIAAFIYMGAAAERARFNTRDILHGLPVSQFMNDRLGDAYEGESAADVASRLLANNLVGARVASGPGPHAFGPPIATDHGIPSLGVVTAWDLAPNGPGNPSIGEKVRSDLPRVNSSEDASRALDMFLGGQVNAVVVVDQDQRVVGLLTQDDVQRAVALAHAMGQGRAKNPAR
jgi:Zn-dependent protease/CBS domain-containing protein